EDGRNIVFRNGFHRASRLELARDKQGGAVVRSLDTGLARHFAPVSGRRAYLREIFNAHGEKIRFEYEHERLARVVDTAGRRIELTHDDNGHLTRLTVHSWIPGSDAKAEPVYVFDYAYGLDGELVSATNALGHSESYAYDERRLLVYKRLPNGLSFHYAYDEDTSRCVRAWGDGGIHAGVLDYDLEQGVTRLSGNDQPMLYAWREDGCILRQASTDGTLSFEFSYDDDQLLLEAKSAAGAVRYAYDERGNQTLFVDPIGGETTYEYENDRCIRRTQAGLTTEYAYDKHGDLVEVRYPSGAHLSIEWDRRGRMAAIYGPDGLRTAFGYDEHHNVIEQRFGRGNVERFGYDALGRTIHYVDPLGHERSWERDALGRPVAARLPDGSIERMEYDVLGRLMKETDVLGRVQSTDYAGLRSPVRIGFADGTALDLTFDTLERPLRITNARNETFDFRYDRSGNVTELRTFDDRIIRTRRDRAQRIQRVELPDGDWRSWTYNAAGDVEVEDSPHGAVRVETSPDGKTYAFVLDDPPGPVLLHLTHDDQHRVVREQQNAHWVEYTYDAQNRVSMMRLSTGHETRYFYDEESNVSALEHQGYRVELERDAAGSVTRRRFVGGGFEERRSWDERSRLVEQWIGSGKTAIVERSYAYNAASELLSLEDARWGGAQYRYDDAGRLVSGAGERFEYDETGSLWREGERWEILKGNLVARAEGTAYGYDAASRRVRAERPNDTVEYRWDCRGRLRAALFSDGRRINFTYDAIGRRIKKEFLVAPNVTEEEQVELPPVRTIEYLWAGECMVAEIDSERGTRVFVYEPHLLVPLLQNERGTIYAVITNHVGTTCELVAPDATLAWAARRSVWGSVLETHNNGSGVESPHVLLGQYRDPELDLCYVRHRWFDSRLARFLSPDPLELLGGLNLFAFNGNPTTHVDPLGLACIIMGDPRSDTFLNYIMNHRTPRPGFYEVYVHGTSTGAYSNSHNPPHGNMTPQDVVNRIQAAGNYPGGPMVMNSCNTGRTPNGTAAQMSSAFGTTVHAPNDLVWGQGPPGPAGAFPSTGGGGIAPAQGFGPRQEYPGHGTTPTYDGTRPGQWNTFTNGQGSPGNSYRPTQNPDGTPAYTPPGYTGP
ncbi:MAG TPA: RHS repeat-associated core domain-containing protein, partial [Polyangiaceae bacterium]|nr:RHS repeat-associated core domain-containing protein [Polyangiaceae bacterium]